MTFEPGARVILDVVPLKMGSPIADPWPCTVVQASPTHALVVPDEPWKTPDGSLIQPWVPLDLLTADLARRTDS